MAWSDQKFLAFRHVIIDEVDRMLDMGFAESVEDIIKESYSGCE